MTATSRMSMTDTTLNCGQVPGRENKPFSFHANA